VGSIVEQPLAIEAICDLTKFVMELHERPGAQVFNCTYEYVDLTGVQILGVTDVTDAVIRMAHGPEIDAELEMLKQLGKQAQKRRGIIVKSCRSTRAVKATKATSSRQKHTPDEGEFHKQSK
jgi:hypothetical protein